MWLRRSILGAAVVVLSGAGLYGWRRVGARADLGEIRLRVVPALKSEVEAAGLAWVAPIFIRIFKESNDLELWVGASDRFQLFKTYRVCNFSGALGPKLKEGDRQSSEGFYAVGPEQMNPRSSYHLSFNLGFPNAYDQARDRIGSYLMVHGDCVSVGCYAMTDQGIEEIYMMAEAAFEGGQLSFQVQAFPFRMAATTSPAMPDRPGTGSGRICAKATTCSLRPAGRPSSRPRTAATSSSRRAVEACLLGNAQSDCSSPKRLDLG